MITRAMADGPTARFALAGEVGRAALEATGRPDAHAGAGATLGSPDPITVGSVIDDRYRIDAETGSGGMAVVTTAQLT